MKIVVGVFFGGRSVEHEISVVTANQAINAFNKDKYSIVPVYVTKDGEWFSGDALLDLKNFKDLKSLPKKCTKVFMKPIHGDYNVYVDKKKMFGKDVLATLDVLFPAFHGTNGEDGIFQGLVQSIGIPFVGCDTLSSSNGMDKITMKLILKECGVPVLDCEWFTDYQFKQDQDKIISDIEAKFSYPVIVKPANLGSSVGISRAGDRESLILGIEEATKYTSRIIVERMVDDLREINCSVIGDCDECEASVCEEPVKNDAILSYKDKYLGGGKSAKGMANTVRKIPADLSDSKRREIENYATDTFKCLSCNGVSRVDFIIDKKDDRVYVNEINTIPGSLAFYLWDPKGLGFDGLVDKLVSLAFKRSRAAGRKIESYGQNIFSLGGIKMNK